MSSTAGSIAERATSATVDVSLISKVRQPDMYTGDWWKLCDFLTQLNINIGFNEAKFKTDSQKVLYACSLMRKKVTDWISHTLLEYMSKIDVKKQQDTFMINNYAEFQRNLKNHFDVMNENQAVKRALHVIWQTELIPDYASEFQRLASLTDWNDDVLNFRFYWSLKDIVKDEIAHTKQSDELQNTVNLTIQINTWIWEHQMKRCDHMSKIWAYSKIQRNHTELKLYMNLMNLDMIEKQCFQEKGQSSRHQSSGGSSQNQRFQSQELQDNNSNSWQITEKCYNCQAPGHFARDCRKPKWTTSNVNGITKGFAVITMHDSLSWTECYDDTCTVHQDVKDEAEWWPKKSRKINVLKEARSVYDTTGMSKPKNEWFTENDSKLIGNISLCVMKEDNIEEVDTHRAQKPEQELEEEIGQLLCDNDESFMMKLRKYSSSEDKDKLESLRSTIDSMQRQIKEAKGVLDWNDSWKVKETATSKNLSKRQTIILDWDIPLEWEERLWQLQEKQKQEFNRICNKSIGERQLLIGSKRWEDAYLGVRELIWDCVEEQHECILAFFWEQYQNQDDEKVTENRKEHFRKLYTQRWRIEWAVNQRNQSRYDSSEQFEAPEFDVLARSYQIEILMSQDEEVSTGGLWITWNGYISAVFVRKVKALEKILQDKYNTFDSILNPELTISRGNNLGWNEEPTWVKELENAKNEKLSQRNQRGRSC